MKTIHFALIAALALPALPAVAQEVKVDLALEMNAAQLHARLASRNQQDIKNVQMHLQHSLNCLVGPKGAGFDPAQTNPCAVTGNGVIPDTKDAAKKTKYAEVVTQIQEALKATDRRPMMESAGKIADSIAEINAQ